MYPLVTKSFFILLILFFNQERLKAQVKTDTIFKYNYDVLKALEGLEEFREKSRLFFDAYTLTTNSNNFETDMFIFEGDILKFIPSGKISTGDFSGYTGPGGHTSTNYVRSIFKVVADKPYGALLCKIGEDGQYRLLGDSIEFTAQTSGRLKFLVNDKDLSDNLGKFESVVYLKSDFAKEDHTIQREGSLVYLTVNQQKELTRIRSQRQYREENKERLAEEALREEERKRAERAEIYRQAKEKSRLENPVVLSEKEAVDLFSACVGYTLTLNHVAGFMNTNEKNKKPHERLSDTSIRERLESHERLISSLIARGAESQLQNFTESLKVATTRITDPTDAIGLTQAVLNTMDSSTVGLDMSLIREIKDPGKVIDLIALENKESVALRFSITKPAGGFFGGELTRWGLKNSFTGEIMVEPEYLFIGGIDEGLRLSKNNQGAVGFLHEDGGIAIPFIYRAGSSFSSGLAPVTKTGERWGYINTKGEVAISFKFAYANGFDLDYPGVAKVRRWLTNQVIYIDTSGKLVKNPK